VAPGDKARREPYVVARRRPRRLAQTASDRADCGGDCARLRRASGAWRRRPRPREGWQATISRVPAGALASRSEPRRPRELDRCAAGAAVAQSRTGAAVGTRLRPSAFDSDPRPPSARNEIEPEYPDVGPPAAKLAPSVLRILISDTGHLSRRPVAVVRSQRAAGSLRAGPPSTRSRKARFAPEWRRGTARVKKPVSRTKVQFVPITTGCRRVSGRTYLRRPRRRRRNCCHAVILRPSTAKSRGTPWAKIEAGA
jgi:hypothetical protein